MGELLWLYKKKFQVVIKKAFVADILFNLGRKAATEICSAEPLLQLTSSTPLSLLRHTGKKGQAEGNDAMANNVDQAGHVQRPGRAEVEA